MAELARFEINHSAITGAQARLYSQFARSGQELTWTAMSRIETEALIAGGANPIAARTVVDEAIQTLIGGGVPGPTRIPWS